MNKEEANRLFEKYREGETSLEEEMRLFSADSQEPEMAEWSRFVKEQKQTAPPNLQDNIWSAIRSRRQGKRRFLYTLSGIAASIALFLVFYFVVPNNEARELAEKEAALKEAWSLFSEETSAEDDQSILYEDELIKIYVAANK